MIKLIWQKCEKTPWHLRLDWGMQGYMKKIKSKSMKLWNWRPTSTFTGISRKSEQRCSCDTQGDWTHPSCFWMPAPQSTSTSVKEFRKWRRVHGLQFPLHPQQIISWVRGGERKLFSLMSFKTWVMKMFYASGQSKSAKKFRLLTFELELSLEWIN